MTNTETRAELQRIKSIFAKRFDYLLSITEKETTDLKIYRLFVKSQQALRKINGLLQHQLDNEDPDDLVTILHLLDALMIIAKTAIKEE